MRLHRPDAYRLLGVSPRAPAETIRERYLALSRIYHPDRAGGSTSATEAFQQISGAYKTLSDASERERHDRELGMRDPLRFAEDTAAERAVHVLDQAASNLRGRRRLPAAKTGRDLRVKVAVPFARALLGGEHPVSVEYESHCDRCDGSGSERASDDPSCHVCDGHGQLRVGLRRESRQCAFCGGRGRVILRPCPDCGGEGRCKVERTVQVAVPVRCRDGALLRVRGAGEHGLHGGKPGDLVADVRLAADPLLTLDGDDIVCALPLSLAEAVLGGSVDVPSLEGIERLRIPAPIGSGQELRVPGRGAPRGKGGRGDLRYRVEVDVPAATGPDIRAAVLALEDAVGAEGWRRRGAFRAAVALRRDEQ